MRTMGGIVVACSLFVAGYAAGFATGRDAGFDVGSEWVMVQAGLLAREAGLHMPVSYDDEGLRVTIRQPQQPLKRSWKASTASAIVSADSRESTLAAGPDSAQ